MGPFRKELDAARTQSLSQFAELFANCAGLGVFCHQCFKGCEYDIREVRNVIAAPQTEWPFLELVAFDCPKGHHCQSILLSSDALFLQACGIAPQFEIPKEPLTATQEAEARRTFGRPFRRKRKMAERGRNTP